MEHGFAKDQVRSPFGNGYDRRVRVARRNEGEHRSVDDAQTFDPVNAKLIIDDALRGANELIFSPSQGHAYAVSPTPPGSVALIDLGGFYTPSILETHSGATSGLQGLQIASEITTSSDGRFVYVVSRLDSAVVVLYHNAETGGLLPVEMVTEEQAGIDGLSGASSIVLSPDGRHVYVSSIDDSAISVFHRNEFFGRLTFIEAHFDDIGGVDGLRRPLAIAVSPDGRNVYIADSGDDALAVFERDPATGALSFLEAQRNGEGGVRGLQFAQAVAVSPEGRHVYTAAARDDALALFNRDPDTGRLTFVDAYFNRQGQILGLDGATTVQVSPDGRHLYAGSQDDDAIVLFERDAEDGRLRYLQTYYDGQDGIEGLAGIQTLALSTDASYLYSVGQADHALAVFERDAISGRLSQLEVHVDDDGATQGLRGAFALAASPNGNVYTVGSESQALVTFRPTRGPCRQGPLTLCLNKNRFRAELEWRDPNGQTGTAPVVPYNTPESGIFWFFSADNWEMQIKVLDGCGINGPLLGLRRRHHRRRIHPDGHRPGDRRRETILQRARPRCPGDHRHRRLRHLCGVAGGRPTEAER